MNKGLKIALIVLASLVALVIIAGFAGWTYVNNTYLNFEKDYAGKIEPEEITVDGYTFLDRNGNGELDVYEDSRRSTEERAADLLAQMTQEEKIHLLKGSGFGSAIGRSGSEGGIPGAAGTIVPTPRLGIPPVYLSDGPAGLRIQPKRPGEDRTYYCTAFPIGTLLASTWNQELVRQVGDAMGEEASEYGIDVILGPGVNIHRHPLCGRNFEYYSEDPVLTGEIGAAMVNGMESNEVGACPKHYVANNQETDRFKNDVRVSERAMREIYLKGFEIIVKKSQPWTIMSSYNKVNGTYTSESKYLLTDILRDEWGFEGVVMTDWFGGSDAPAQVAAGNDLLEPGTNIQWKALKKAAEKGELSDEAIHTSARRILELIVKSNKLDGEKPGNDPDLEAHARVTRQSAAEGMVLLKNDNTLPIREARNAALFGVTSYDFIAGGTGSGDVNEAYTVSLEEGLRNAGFEINETARQAFEAHREANPEGFDKPVGMNAMFQPYDPPEMEHTAELLSACADEADIALITIGRNSGEGGDRVVEDDFRLSEKEQKMITDICEAFHAVGKKVVVVLNIGGVIETASWKEQPDAILLAWQGGQEGGNSVADILVGRVNPSGKLPMTFPLNIEDHASHANFPLEGKPMSMWDIFTDRSKEIPEAEQVENQDYTLYEEGIYVGYRHFDKQGLEVSYPFGYGLSYTSFEYADLEVSLSNDTLDVRLSVQNAGEQSGKEVVQVYVGKPDTRIDRPVKELKAFAKTPELAPGERVELNMQIPVSELRYWDEEQGGWMLERGTYSVQVGVSSRELRLTGEVEI